MAATFSEIGWTSSIPSAEARSASARAEFALVKISQS